MNQVRVWAPLKQCVELMARGTRFPMHKGEDGYFEAGIALEDGERYAFSIDGGPPFPDPRSKSQPDGVHGGSEWLELEPLPRGDFVPAPLHEAVFYELHVGTFSPEGTFDGAIALLPHLADLGVTHVELMPVASFPGEFGWGYDGASPFAPQHCYGGPAGLRRFVHACHDHRLGVILDVVYNHLGPSGNYLGAYAPYFTSRYATPWGLAVNFDGAYSDEVRRFFVDNALHWLGTYGMDGLRLDAVHAIFDNSALHFFEELSCAVLALSAEVNRKLLLIAESDLNNPRLVRSRASGGYGLDAMWSDDFHHALYAVLTDDRSGYYEDFGPIAHLVKALRDGFVYDGSYSHHRKRRHGRPATDVARERFVVCLQNHDQVGNRAKGDRLGHSIDPELLKIGAALVILSPYVPLLFQGEEWSTSSPFAYFTDHGEPELAEAVRKGRRQEFVAFGWKAEDIPDPQSHETFLASKLRWEERLLEPHRGVLNWYRELIQLRHRLGGACTRSELGIGFDEQRRFVWLDRNNTRLVANLSREQLELNVPFGSELLTTSRSGTVVTGSSLLLPGPVAAVLRLR